MIDPCIPAAWPGFEMTLRYRGAVYEISVRNPAGVSRGVVAAAVGRRVSARLVGQGAPEASRSATTARHTITVTLATRVGTVVLTALRASSDEVI